MGLQQMIDTKELERRGRPRIRRDGQILQLIYSAALHEFEVSGYAGTSMENLARRAGISTKTPYRIVPHKSELLRALVSDRFERFVADFRLRVPELVSIEDGLSAALSFFANFALRPEVVGLQRIILQEISQFPELGTLYYRDGIMRAVAEISKWLSRQVKRGTIRIDDCDEAAGALIGMITSAPQRATLYAGLPLPTRQDINRRVRTCVALFLDGCRLGNH